MPAIRKFGLVKYAHGSRFPLKQRRSPPRPDLAWNAAAGVCPDPNSACTLRMPLRFSIFLLLICHSAAGPVIASIDVARTEVARKRRAAVPNLAARNRFSV
jgi:hypothetical protein